MAIFTRESRAGRVGLALAVVVAGIGEPLAGRPQPGAKPWTTQNVIDARIDVEAQTSLIRMFESGADAAVTASVILSAVKAGHLAGIYQQDQRAPALRAQKVGKGWWQLFDGTPSGRLAICWKEPPGSAPMMVLRRGVKSGRDTLDPALRDAWEQCGLPTAAPRPYVRTLPPRPGPAGEPPSEAAGGKIIEQPTAGGKTMEQTWERGFDWDGQFSGNYDSCWQTQQVAASRCRSVSDLAGASDGLSAAYLLLGSHCNKPSQQWPLERFDELRACCSAADRAKRAVDSCVTNRVWMSATAATGTAASGNVLRVVKTRYADWKRRKAKP